jgi:hypothetical protein
MHKSIFNWEMDVVRNRSDAAKETHLNYRSGVTASSRYTLNRAGLRPTFLPVRAEEIATKAEVIGTIYGRTTDPGSWYKGFAPHLALSIFIACGMTIAGWLQFAFHHRRAADVALLIAIAGSSIPLCIELITEILKRNFSVDALAILSIATALVLWQYWVAAIVILMLSSDKAVEELPSGERPRY